MAPATSHTPGPWSVFICDDGGQWSGWPLSISADLFTDKTVVRPGGFYPYEWDAGVSQNEAVANARLIAAAPDMLAALTEAKFLFAAIRQMHSIDDNSAENIVQRVFAEADKGLAVTRAAIAKAEGQS